MADQVNRHAKIIKNGIFQDVNFKFFRTQLLKRIYDEYDLNVKMYEKPVGFTLKHGSNESNNYTNRLFF